MPTDSEWRRARWVVLYILHVHGDTHLYAIQEIARERFRVELTGYMMGRFRSHGILTWPSGARTYSITGKGREELLATR